MDKTVLEALVEDVGKLCEFLGLLVVELVCSAQVIKHVMSVFFVYLLQEGRQDFLLAKESLDDRKRDFNGRLLGGCPLATLCLFILHVAILLVFVVVRGARARVRVRGGAIA